MLTIIISSVVLLRFGVSGTTGMFFVMAHGRHGVHGAFGFRAGHHRFQDRLLAGLHAGGAGEGEVPRRARGVASPSGLTIVMLAQTFQFGEAAPGDLRVVLPSPQASIMKALVEGFMSRQPVAYILFGAGAAIARHHGNARRARADLRAGHVPAAGAEHAGAGGRLPGALPRQALRKRGRRARRAMRERGVIIASGLMAGGALGGVFGAACRLIPGYSEDWIQTPFYGNEVGLAVRLGRAVRGPVRLSVVRHPLRREKENEHERAITKNWSATPSWASTRSGAATSCAPPAPAASSPIPGSRDEPLPAAYTVAQAAPRARHRAASRPKRPTRRRSKPTSRSRYSRRHRRPEDGRGRIRRTARRISRAASRCASRPCGTWPWRCSAKARRCPTSAACWPPPARRPSPPTPAPSASASPNCWLAPDTRDRDRAAGRGGRLAQARIASPWRPSALLGAAVIAPLRRAHRRATSLPYLPAELRDVPRANIQFLPIQDAWFSGSMNYLGRARRAGRQRRSTRPPTRSTPRSRSRCPSSCNWSATRWCPATSPPSPICRTSTARGLVGFEASVLTMNTRAAALFEGIANNAILMAHGVTEVDQLPDEDLQIGVLLALLQDDAKNQSSYLTWGEGAAASRSGRHPAPRFPGVAGARRQALRRLGTPPAARPHVPARLPRRHEKSRCPAPRPQAGSLSPRVVWSLRPGRRHNDRQNVGRITRGADPSGCRAGALVGLLRIAYRESVITPTLQPGSRTRTVIPAPLHFGRHRPDRVRLRHCVPRRKAARGHQLHACRKQWKIAAQGHLHRDFLLPRVHQLDVDPLAVRRPCGRSTSSRPRSRRSPAAPAQSGRDTVSSLHNSAPETRNSDRN